MHPTGFALISITHNGPKTHLKPWTNADGNLVVFDTWEDAYDDTKVIFAEGTAFAIVNLSEMVFMNVTNFQN